MTLYRVSDRSDTFVLDNGKAPATQATSGGRGRNPQEVPTWSP